MPIFSQYLFLIELESLNYFVEPLSFHLANKSLYHLYLFQLAKEKRKTIKFEYIKYLEDVPKIKTVNVYSISLRGRKLFIIALDTSNGELRHYIFTQITRVILVDLKTDFKTPSPDLISNFYSDSIEAFEGDPPQKVILRLTKESEVYLRKEFFHKSQNFSRDEKGNLQIEMSTNNANELFAMISKFMKDIEIIQPIEWRDQYINNLRASLQLHKKD